MFTGSRRYLAEVSGIYSTPVFILIFLWVLGLGYLLGMFSKMHVELPL